MNKKNLLSGRDKELQEMADTYEQRKAEGRSIYMDAEDMADLADWYALRHKPELAQEVVSYGLDIHPGNTSLLVQQAYLYLESDKVDNALQVAGLIEEETTEATILKAQMQLIMGKHQACKALLNTIDKDDVANIVEVAYMYMDEGYDDEAYKWIALGKGQYEDDAAFQAVCAEYYFSRHQLDKAIDYYNKLIDGNPYSPFYWQGLARCYFEQGAFDKTIDACDYATLSDDEYADAYVLRASAYYELGNFEEALDNYKEAERLQAISPSFIYFFQGMDKVAKNEWQEACSFLKKSAESVGSDDESVNLPLVRANVGLCLYKLGKKEEARAEWEKAHRLNPEEPLSYLIEGRAYMEGQETDLASAAWKKAVDLAPYPETWDEIGLYCLNAGQPRQASQAFEQTKELDPGYPHIHEKLAMSYLMAGDKEQFEHYNRLSAYPIRQERLDSFYEQLNNIDKEDMMQLINRLLRSLD